MMFLYFKHVTECDVYLLYPKHLNTLLSKSWCILVNPASRKIQFQIIFKKWLRISLNTIHSKKLVILYHCLSEIPTSWQVRIHLKSIKNLFAFILKMKCLQRCCQQIGKFMVHIKTSILLEIWHEIFYDMNFYIMKQNQRQSEH